jgi:hypothetical protein
MSVKQDEHFQHSPKHSNRSKYRKISSSSSRSDRSAPQTDDESSTHTESSDARSMKGKEKENFGTKPNDTDVLLHVGSPPKRLAAEMLEESPFGTPRKHKKGKVSVDEDGEGDWEVWEPAPAKKKHQVL